MSKRDRNTMRVRARASDKETKDYVAVDDDDFRNLNRLANRFGVTVDTLLNAAIALLNREVSGEPIPASTVEYLAKRGFSILDKKDLN
jgi:hypothetical protein